MKKFSIVLSALVLMSGFGVTAASAQIYLSGNLGAVRVNDADLSFQGVTFAEMISDTGLGITGGIGHEYANGLRSEIELGYRTNNLDTLRGTGPLAGLGAHINGDIRSISLMLNGYYDFAIAGPAAPFIGAGLGFARISIDSDALQIDDSDTVFAYQIAFGGSFALSPKMNLVLQYRLFGTSDPTFTTHLSDRLKTEYMTRNFLAGLRYRF